MKRRVSSDFQSPLEDGNCLWLILLFLIDTYTETDTEPLAQPGAGSPVDISPQTVL
jgi:hypothetical protein